MSGECEKCHEHPLDCKCRKISKIAAFREKGIIGCFYYRDNEMDKRELVVRLKEISEWYKDDKFCDEEEMHIQADCLLLKYIDDEEVTKAFHDIPKWYS